MQSSLGHSSGPVPPQRLSLGFLLPTSAPPLQVTECLTTVKSVNKTDSQTLLTTFGVRNNSRVPTDISTCFAFREV